VAPELDAADAMQNLNLALIGNCTLGALIDRRGRYVWCCYPRVDGDPLQSPPRAPGRCFASDFDPPAVPREEARLLRTRIESVSDCANSAE
jgi:hypothetical protein